MIDGQDFLLDLNEIGKELAVRGTLVGQGDVHAYLEGGVLLHCGVSDPVKDRVLEQLLC